MTLSPPESRRKGLSTAGLKILACVAMLIDHIGYYLVPGGTLLYHFMRYFGRLAFPIFAFCIALGCRYTRNKLKHFLCVFGLGVICEVAYFIYDGKLEGNILLTFSCSILIIYAVQFTKKALAQRNTPHIVLGFAAFLGMLGLSYVANRLLGGISYGLFGISLPVFASLVDYKEGEAPLFLRWFDKPGIRVACFAVGLFIHWFTCADRFFQFFAFFSLIPIAMYNGTPGTKKLKWAFYAFYPVHLLLIWLIGILLYGL